MAASEGLNIVLTPVQLAAVLHGENISAHEITVNRFWGATKVLGGALELAGAGALWLMPEPTMLTKAGGAVLGAHGCDTFIAGVRQVWTGASTKTLTQEGGEALAYSLGADRQGAERTGVIVDVAVPLVVAAMAVAIRIAAVRAGRIVLAEEELAGGHTILKHVGQTEAQLRARLLAEAQIPAATSFSSLRAAESAVTDGIRANATQIRAWAAAGRTARMRFVYDAAQDVGYGVVRASGKLEKMQKIRVVLQALNQNGKVYFVLTAFPIP
jgi:hypothetical protein